jgi:quercetin dioxygenase-like cupin family protein
MATIAIVRRSEIPAISEIMEHGELHNLGEQRDFRRHPLLDEFIPKYGRLSLAWVRLRANEILAPHRHPTASLLLCTEGRGIVLELPDRVIEPGDAVLVPSGSIHGFKGLAPSGIEGLSIQFDDRGLYEDPSKPRVEFERD